MKKDLDLGFDQAKKVGISSVNHPEIVLDTIDKKQDINTFINKLKVDKWNVADLPADAKKENVYKMYQEGTVKLGEASNKGKKELKQVATITTYKGIPYIDVEIKNLNLNLKVPNDVSEYLSSQSQQKH
ncbi:lipoprotein, putative [Priestia megaterium]|nr:lipoprotein, putative [Priestia megaterium]